METAFKPLLIHFLKAWILYAGAIQIMNSASFIITGNLLIEGPVWQIVFPAIMVPVIAWIERSDRGVDSKQSTQ